MEVVEVAELIETKEETEKQKRKQRSQGARLDFGYNPSQKNQERASRKTRSRRNHDHVTRLNPAADLEANRERDNSHWGTFLYGLGASIPTAALGAFGFYFAGIVYAYATHDDCVDHENYAACFASEPAGLGAAAGCILGACLGGFFWGRKAHKEERGGCNEGFETSKNNFGCCFKV